MPSTDTGPPAASPRGAALRRSRLRRALLLLAALIVALIGWRHLAQTGAGSDAPGATSSGRPGAEAEGSPRASAGGASPGSGPAADGADDANGPSRGGLQAGVPVVLADVTEAVDNLVVEVSGSGLADSSVTLFPGVAGEVSRVLFKAGDRVRAGQVLVRLVDRPERLAADLAATRVDAAARLLQRYEGTRGTGAVPGSVIDDAELALRTARIQLAQARVAVSDREVRAPFPGVMGIAQVAVGDRVGTDTPVATLDDRRVLQVQFDVPEVYIDRIALGQPVTVNNAAFGDRAFTGRLALVDSRVDAASRTVRVRAAVPNTDDLLRHGMSFRVRLELPGEAVASVPELALQWQREGAFVWTVKDDRAVQVPVRPVRRLQGQVLVDGDLRPGQRVVVEGVQRLRPDRAVVVLGGAGTEKDAGAAGAPVDGRAGDASPADNGAAASPQGAR